MQREDRRRQIGPRNRQTAENNRHHDRCRGVQQDIHQVIAERRVSPQFVFDPKGAVHQGIVLLRGAHLEPDPVQAVPRAEIGARHVRVVVPYRAAAPGRPIGQKNRGHQRQGKKPPQSAEQRFADFRHRPRRRPSRPLGRRRRGWLPLDSCRFCRDWTLPPGHWCRSQLPSALSKPRIRGWLD